MRLCGMLENLNSPKSPVTGVVCKEVVKLKIIRLLENRGRFRLQTAATTSALPEPSHTIDAHLLLYNMYCLSPSFTLSTLLHISRIRNCVIILV